MTNIYSGRKKVLIDPGRYAKKRRKEIAKKLLISSQYVALYYRRSCCRAQSVVMPFVKGQERKKKLLPSIPILPSGTRCSQLLNTQHIDICFCKKK